MAVNSVVVPISQPVAASGSVVGTVIALPKQAERVEFHLFAGYLAAAGTSGVNFLFQISPDNITYTNAVMPGAVAGVIAVKNAATTNPDTKAVLYLESPQIQNTIGPINFVKITATNTDATNNVAVAALAYIHAVTD